MEVFVPEGFKAFEKSDGIFIENSLDNMVFKWISTRDLRKNGIDSNGTSSQYGRRNFNGIFDDLINGWYSDPESEQFEDSVKKHGGFFISTEKFNKCYHDQADSEAKKYLEGSKDAQSVLPSGEAFDCLFEHIYEKFSEYVLKNKMPNENAFEAWNRIATEKRPEHISKGIFGIKELLDSDYEHSSEMQSFCPVFRSTPLMILNKYIDLESRIDTNIVTWYLGIRHFTHPQNAFFDYRIVILLK